MMKIKAARSQPRGSLIGVEFGVSQKQMTINSHINQLLADILRFPPPPPIHAPPRISGVRYEL